MSTKAERDLKALAKRVKVLEEKAGIKPKEERAATAKTEEKK